MVENMFFPDNEHAGIGAMLPPQKSCLFVQVMCLVSKNYFTRFFCCSYYYVCSRSLQIKYHITRKTLFDPNVMLFFWIEYSQNDEVLKS